MKKFQHYRHLRFQVMVEFLIMAFLCVIVTFSLVKFLGIYAEYAWRILSLVSLDYP